MAAAVTLDDRKRVRVACRCGFPLVAFPIMARGIRYAGYAAERDLRTVERGQNVDHCPACGQDLRMTWQQLQEQLAGTFRP